MGKPLHRHSDWFDFGAHIGIFGCASPSLGFLHSEAIAGWWTDPALVSSLLMSQSSTDSRVENQLKLLLERVNLLETRVAELERDRLDSGFELVATVPSAVIPHTSGYPAGHKTVEAETVVGSGSNLVENDRDKVLHQIGGWIKQTLKGQRRGLSGRERLSEGNSVYLVFRDHSGRVLEPAGLFYKFSQVVPVVQPRGDVGDSVFIGLPSPEDAKIVCQAARVRFPGN